MERREKNRQSCRMPVYFWERGSEKRYVGYTANLSPSGMYITANRLPSKGQRIRVQLRPDGEDLMIEAVVARVSRSMQRLQPSGLGIRFLRHDEIIGGLLTDESGAPPPVAAPRRSASSPPAGPPSTVQPRTARPRVAREFTSGTPSAPVRLPRDPLAGEAAYRLRYPRPESFLTAYRRDLMTGGLFVPTPKPADLNHVITIELSVADTHTMPVRFQARVVHRLDPESSGGARKPGMGLEILNFPQTLVALRALAARLEPRA